MTAPQRPPTKRRPALKFGTTSRWNLRSRLVAITLLPILGFSLWFGAVTESRLRQTERAATVRDRVGRLSAYLNARTALTAEQVPTQAKLAISVFGVPASFSSMILGFDPDQRMKEVRPVTERAFQDEAADLLPALRRLRSIADTDAPSSVRFDQTFREFDAIQEELRERSKTEYELIGAAVGNLDGERDLWRSVEVVIAVEDLANQYQNQTSLVFEIRSSKKARNQALAELASSSALADRDMEVIRTHAGELTRSDFAKFVSEQSSIDAKKITESVFSEDDESGFQTIDFANLQREAGLFNTMLQRGEGARKVLTFAQAETRERSLQVQRSARNELLLTFLLAATIALVSIAFASVLARSVSSPLRSLARRAARIGGGDLSGDPLPETGPQEVVQVGKALNELVANLVVLDRQASALAAGDLEHSIFDDALPGALGRSMQETVSRLRASIQNREELRSRLAHQATHDDLTGLPNRKSLVEAIHAALGRSRRQQTGIAVSFIDLDGFKRANDTYGHRFGDQVLVLCADRLVGHRRQGDFIARIGGDEFVIVSENIADSYEALSIANRYISVLSEPVSIDNKSANIGASIGIALDFQNEADATILLRDADLAVYRAKANGGGRAEICDLALRSQIERRDDLERAVVDAIRKDELRLEYQPILRSNASGSSVASAEALLRWDRPGHGPISPADFVPLLESSPRIVDLGRWVMKSVLRDASHWVGAAAGMPVAINVSARHLVASTFLSDLQTALDQSGIDPRRVVLEITETSLVDNVTVAVNHLEAARGLGLRVALDDFGTGFTSIRQLRDFPVDILKIDRSFVERIHDPDDQSLVRMMIGVAGTLGLDILAEGVETTEQAKLLTSLGCRLHQGYFYARPLRPDAFKTYVAEKNRSVVVVPFARR